MNRSRWHCQRAALNSKFQKTFLAVILAGIFLFPAMVIAAETFIEDFNSRTSNATIDNVELWKVTAGASSNGIVQSGTTPNGSGNSLKLTGASTPVTVSRTSDYGNVTPTWMRLRVQAGIGAEQRANPSSGIAAVSFDFTGKILASNGKSWTDTGVKFTAGKWYEVIYKLDFTNHLYDVYINSVASPVATFTPAKTNLQFIDSSISKLSTLEFQGAYNASQQADFYVDDVTVYYVDRLGFSTPAQTIVQDQASNPITVELRNSLLVPQKAWEDLTLALTTTSAGGSFSLSPTGWSNASTITIPKDATSITFYYKDSKIGKPTISVKESPDRGWIPASQDLNIIAKSPHFDVLADTPQTAAAPFTLTLVARKDTGDLDTAYAGTVQLSLEYMSPATGTKQITPTEVSGFENGQKVITVTYPDAGLIQIDAVDTKESDKKGTSGQILVLPHHLTVSADAKQTVGVAFALTVSAVDASGNVTPNYQSTVNLSAKEVLAGSAGGTLTPATISGSAFQGGVATVNVKYSYWGSIDLLSSDAGFPAVKGESSAITLNPKKIQVKATPPPVPRTYYFIDEPFEITVSALDGTDAPISNFAGTVDLTAQARLGLPESYTFSPSNNGSKKFNASASTAAFYDITAKDKGSGLVGTVNIEVREIYVRVISTSAPAGGTADVSILVTDKNGQLIKNEGSLFLNVKLIESQPNGSLSSIAQSQPIQVINGQATFGVSNSDSETVTVVPASLFGLKIETGTITFGKLANKGVGVLLWREIREVHHKEKKKTEDVLDKLEQ